MPRTPKSRASGWVLNSSSTTDAINDAALWHLWNREVYRCIHPVTASTTGYVIEAGTTASVTAANEMIWHVWNYREAHLERRYEAALRHAETPEQREARRIETERRDAQNRAAAAVTQAAKERAEKLLQSVLTDEQKTELRDKGYFHCRSKQGNRYRIRRGTHGNVRKLDPTGTKEIESLCIQPRDVPEGDVLLAQRFMIENDEEAFRKTANIARMLN